MLNSRPISNRESFSSWTERDSTDGLRLHDLTYQLLASQKNYGAFSNTAYTDKNGNTFNSIENMHNIVHSLVGNGGHMGYVPYAAFDPIFWLHHS